MHFIQIENIESIEQWADAQCDCTETAVIVDEYHDLQLDHIAPEARVARWAYYATVTDDGSSKAVVIGPLGDELRAALALENAQAVYGDGPTCTIETWEQGEDGEMQLTGSYLARERELPAPPCAGCLKRPVLEESTVCLECARQFNEECESQDSRDWRDFS